MVFQGRQAILDATNAKDWKKEGHGFVKDKKPDDTLRVLLENYNSLQCFTDKKDRTRINIINHTCRRLQVDAIAGLKPGTDWTITRQLDGEAYHNLFGLGEDQKSIYTHDKTKQISKSQYAETCMMEFGVFSSHIKKVNLNPDKCKDRLGWGATALSSLQANQPNPWE